MECCSLAVLPIELQQMMNSERDATLFGALAVLAEMTIDAKMDSLVQRERACVEMAWELRVAKKPDC